MNTQQVFDEVFGNKLRANAQRRLLKYAAGQQIECPLCSTILDWRRTVIIELGHNTKVCCASCWDDIKQRAENLGRSLAGVSVIDGRKL